MRRNILGVLALSVVVLLATATAAMTATTGTTAKQLSGSLNVAVYGGPTLLSWQKSYAEPFEATTGVKTTLAGVPYPASLAISQKGDPQFDLLLVTGTDAANLAAQSGVVQLIDPKAIPRSGKVISALTLGQGKKWIAVPAFTTYYGLVVNTTKYQPKSITSWANLTQTRFKNQLFMNSPSFGATTDVPMLALANGGSMNNIEPGFSLLEKVVPNVRATITSLGDLASAMASGDAGIAPMYFSQYSQLLDRKLPVQMILPKEGGLLSPVYLLMPAGAKNQANALAFLNYVLSSGPQDRAMRIASYIPVVNIPLSLRIKKRSGFKTTTTMIARLRKPNFHYFAANQAAWVARTEQILAG